MLNCGISGDRLKQWNSGVKLPLKLTLHRIIIWSPTLTTELALIRHSGILSVIQTDY